METKSDNIRLVNTDFLFVRNVEVVCEELKSHAAIVIFFDAHSMLLKSHGHAPGQTEWNDVEIKITQSVDSFRCDECFMEFDLANMEAREIMCPDHELREIEFEW